MDEVVVYRWSLGLRPDRWWGLLPLAVVVGLSAAFSFFVPDVAAFFFWVAVAMVFCGARGWWRRRTYLGEVRVVGGDYPAVVLRRRCGLTRRVPVERVDRLRPTRFVKVETDDEVYTTTVTLSLSIDVGRRTYHTFSTEPGRTTPLVDALHRACPNAVLADTHEQTRYVNWDLEKGASPG